MAITHSTAVRTAVADSIDALVNAGSTFGKLKILTSANAVLATVTLQKPAFGSASSGVITLAGTPLSATAAGDGTAAKFSVTDSDDNIIFTGSCGLSGSSPDLTIDNTSIITGQTVTVTAHAYTAAL